MDSSGNLYIADTSNNRVRKVTPDGTISTVAGTGTSGYSGDGGLATAATLYHPGGMVVDSSGNLYIADMNNNRIRKVTPFGTISTVAGNGTAGYSGDGGQATSAELYIPEGVAIDSSGNLYIADSFNHRIRRVGPLGNIGTVAGTGTAGYSGDGGQATSVKLHYPSGVAFDSSGNLLIVDTGNSCIRRVGALGNIGTVAGTGTDGYSGDGGQATSALLYNPDSVAVDSSGNLYIADSGNHAIRRVTAGGTISTIAGTGTFGYTGDGGPATSARLYTPSGVAVDAAGRVFVADTLNSAVRVLTTSSSSSSCGYAVSTDDLGVPVSGGQVKVTLHTGAGCPWTLSSLPSWLTAASGSSSGAASADIDLTAAANGGAARVGTFSLAGVSVPIRQVGASDCGGAPSCGIRTLPHLAFGNEWTTGLFAINSDTQNGTFSIAFCSSEGATQSVPFTGGTGTNTSLTDMVTARGVNYYEASDRSWPTTGAWGLVTAPPTITVHGVFRRNPAEGGYYEAGVAATGGYSSFVIPFDATTFTEANASFYTGFAISSLNPSAAAVVACVARDQTGATIANAVSVPALNPMGHRAGYSFPALAGKRGTLECSADTLVTALALHFIGTSAFATLPVIAK